MQEKIVVKGARTHNLKNITVEMPRNKMIVITGLSGSGKSSLAFDTIFAEGQRRYVESLSAYARQFLGNMQKPDVDEILGLSPAISIDQKTRSNNPRSTVATVTEIYDYLRVLYARVADAHCMICGKSIQRLTKEEIVNIIYNEGEKLASISQAQAKKVFGVAVDDARVAIYAPVVRGRKGEYYQMLYDFLNKGYEFARIDGQIYSLRERIKLDRNKKHDIDILIDEIYLSEFKDKEDTTERIRDAVGRSLDEANGLVKVELPNKEEKLISATFTCPDDGFSFPEIEPRLFSFNSPYGACPACRGLGSKHFFASDEAYDPCELCGGSRLRKEALHVFLTDKKGNKKNIVELTEMSVEDAYSFLTNIYLDEKRRQIAEPVLKEIVSRLQFMKNVGIEYLTLNRRANTLSGGESQRIRLASQLGSGLVGALYVLDEPTIGLHQHDNDRLIKTLEKLRDLGNTIIVVEHDQDTILASDYLIDIGPGAGEHGGEVVVAGYTQELLNSANKNKSLTLDYLQGKKEIVTPKKRRVANKGALRIKGAKKHNIVNLDAEIPLGRFVAITGVSGSGKSTFMYDILYKNLRAAYDRRYMTAHRYNVANFSGVEYANRVILLDQSPIGRTPRSNPATYTGAWSYIRDLFAQTKEARARGYKPGIFSFNVKGGRCEACQGNGVVAVEMHFLPTVYVTCDVCLGKRFMKETLEIKYKGKNIYEILEMTIEEAKEFFDDIAQLKDRLQALLDVGLGYLKIGQPATHLSGGEAQRVKIASELFRPDTTKTIYLLDEPTVGLHFEDVRKLVEILQKLVERGNTVIVIEHNLDLIKNADYILDFGPKGGIGGGRIIAKGTPEEVAKDRNSLTGKYLKKIL